MFSKWYGGLSKGFFWYTGEELYVYFATKREEWEKFFWQREKMEKVVDIEKGLILFQLKIHGAHNTTLKRCFTAIWSQTFMQSQTNLMRYWDRAFVLSLPMKAVPIVAKYYTTKSNHVIPEQLKDRNPECSFKMLNLHLTIVANTTCLYMLWVTEQKDICF